MSPICLSWTIGAGKNCPGGNKKYASWNEIIQALLEVKDQSGTVTLDLIKESEVGPRSLQVESEDGRSILTLGENNTDEYSVRTFTNADIDSKQLKILGSLWDSRLICFDFNLVISIFKEFFETGNVSRQLLS